MLAGAAIEAWLGLRLEVVEVLVLVVVGDGMVPCEEECEQARTVTGQLGGVLVGVGLEFEALCKITRGQR